MARRSSPSSIAPRDLPIAAIVIAAAAVGISLLVGGWGRTHGAPLPFVWRDVALVHFLAALPLALLAAQRIRPHLSALATISLAGAAALVAGLVVAGIHFPPDLAICARLLVAFALALAATLGALCFVTQPAPKTNGTSRPFPTAATAVSAAILLVVPLFYVQARSSHDQRRLAELIDQSRIGEARDLAQGLVALGSKARLNGKPIAAEAGRLDRRIAEIAERAYRPLPPEANAADHYERARDLAILGDTDLALALINSSALLRDSVPAALLSGAIHQARGDWQASMAAFSRARSLIESQPTSAQQAAARLEAITGIAFAQRKLGDNAAAAASYQELLALAPTADSHFLLAQFYEDTQQTRLAARHAREAARLDSTRYAAPAERLITKLRRSHFSCWGVP